MKTVRITLTEDEYNRVLRRKAGKTHKEIYLDGLGIDYTPPALGRPAAFDVQAAEQKMRDAYMDKIREANEANRDKHLENLKNLGHDVNRERPSFIKKKRR